MTNLGENKSGYPGKSRVNMRILTIGYLWISLDIPRLRMPDNAGSTVSCGIGYSGYPGKSRDLEPHMLLYLEIRNNPGFSGFIRQIRISSIFLTSFRIPTNPDIQGYPALSNILGYPGKFKELSRVKSLTYATVLGNPE